MKVLVLLVCSFVATTLAQQHHQNQNHQQQREVDNKRVHVPIIAHESNLQHDGSFNYLFESGDGTRAEQNGKLKYVDQDNAGEAVEGQFSYQVRKECWKFL